MIFVFLFLTYFTLCDRGMYSFVMLESSSHVTRRVNN